MRYYHHPKTSTEEFIMKSFLVIRRVFENDHEILNRRASEFAARHKLFEPESWRELDGYLDGAADTRYENSLNLRRMWRYVMCRALGENSMDVNIGIYCESVGVWR
jgi:hypothetical protein